MGLLRRPRKTGNGPDMPKTAKTVGNIEQMSITELRGPIGHPTPECSKIESSNADGLVDNNQIVTGPEPFPYRLAKKGCFQVNPLLEFTNEMDEVNRPMLPQEKVFSLQDFLLKRTNSYIPFGEKSKRETSSQNYELSYQRNEYQNRLEHIREITMTLNKDVLNAVDINKLAAIDSIPRRVPHFQQNLNEKADERYAELEQIHFDLMHSNHLTEDQTNQFSQNEQQQNIYDQQQNTYEQHIHDLKTNYTPNSPKQPGKRSSVEIDVTFSMNELGSDKVTQHSREEGRDTAISSKPVGTPIAPVTSKSDVDEHRSRSHIVKSKPSPQVPYSALELAIHESLSESGGLTLSLRGWFLEYIPSMPPLELSLVYLNLSFNSLTELPEVVFNCVNLKVLKVRNNPISEISESILKLRKLRILIAPFCRISKISDGLFKLPLMIYMDLSYNCLTSIPKQIGMAGSLRFLNLAGNELRGLPHQAIQLQLEKVRLKNNFMKKAFWKDYNLHKVSPLSSLCLKVVSLSTMKLSSKIRTQVLKQLTVCDNCNNNFNGQGYLLLRPCEEIWGKKNVPFLFNCCSWRCYQECKSADNIDQLKENQPR